MSIISDVATLVKAGFSLDDIKDIVKADKEGTIQKEPKKEPDPEPDKKDPDPEPDKKDPDPEPDYKALYEKSQEDLKKAQADNTKKDIKPEPLKIDDVIANIKKEIC